MQGLWRNYIAENPYAGSLDFDSVLTTVEAMGTMLDAQPE